MNQVNHELQQWKGQEARSLWFVWALTELIQLLSTCPGLSESQQIDFTERIDTPDLPLGEIHILKGNDLFFSWILTSSVSAKRRCCHATQLKMLRAILICEESKNHSLILMKFSWNRRWRLEYYLLIPHVISVWLWDSNNVSFSMIGEVIESGLSSRDKFVNGQTKSIFVFSGKSSRFVIQLLRWRRKPQPSFCVQGYLASGDQAWSTPMRRIWGI
jgi:hypothetical protein